MSNDSSHKTVDNIEDILQWQREPVPDTSDLQAAIINQAKGLPQQLEIPAKPARSRVFKLFTPRWMATAACLMVVAISAAFLVPNGSLPPADGSDQITLEELELQELMLLEDELLFAGI